MGNVRERDTGWIVKTVKSVTMKKTKKENGISNRIFSQS